MTEARRVVLRDVLPRYHVVPAPGEVDLRQLFPGRTTVIDFGAGMGAHTLALAQSGVGVLAIDVHAPGICAVAAYAQEHRLDTVIAHLGDGVPLLADRVTAGSADEIHVLFPDPWPKARHHKRRLVNDVFLHVAHRVLTPGGRLAVVTDDHGYAVHISQTVTRSGLFTNSNESFEYQATGYHNRAMRLARTPVVFTLRAQ